MTIRTVEGPPGAPWGRALHGALDTLVVESELLAGNPLGDPARRPLYVYRSPGVVAGSALDVASVYMLQGFTGQVDQWLARSTFDPTTIERIDALYDPAADGPCPEAVIVFLDAWTSIGGSQFLNSPATGRYLDYVCDEIVPFVDSHYPTAATPGRRAVTGHSSGGYGAMVLPMLRPDVFGALLSSAGDALFEVCYLPDVGKVVRRLRDDFEGSYEVFLRELEARTHFDFARFGDCMSMYAMAACYSPDQERPGAVLLPFEIRTGRLIEEIWQLWLERDPVRMAPAHAPALQGLRVIHLVAGRSDEYSLDLGAQAFSDQLEQLGVDHKLELHDGRHGGNSHRYASWIRGLLLEM